MTKPILTPLVARRAELAGEMHTLQSRLHQVHADLASLDDVIKQFDPEYQLAAIRPKYRRQVTPAETATISRAVLDTLRRAGKPLSAKEVARAIMAQRGLDGEDMGLVRSMAKRVDMALRYQRTNGTVAEAGQDGVKVLWEVAGN